MSSITIHNIENDLDLLIREKAKKDGLSLNKEIKKLLRESLGLTKNENIKKDEFAKFFGIWSDEDKKIFDKQVADLEKIDQEDWK